MFQDFSLLDVVRGKVTGITSLKKCGHDNAIGTTWETLWGQSTLYSYPATASIMTVSSSNTADASGSTGAWNVHIYGLDGNYNEADELVILNGQAPVNTSNDYLRVYRMSVEQAGTGLYNAGVLYVGTGSVTGGVPTNIYSTIPVGMNHSSQGFYTVPAGYTAYLAQWAFSCGEAYTYRFRLYVRPYGMAWQVLQQCTVNGNTVVEPQNLPLNFDEKTDIEVRTQLATGSGGEASVQLDFLLISNT